MAAITVVQCILNVHCTLSTLTIHDHIKPKFQVHSRTKLQKETETQKVPLSHLITVLVIFFIEINGGIETVKAPFGAEPLSILIHLNEAMLYYVIVSYMSWPHRNICWILTRLCVN